LYAINGSDGKKLWNFSARDKIESSPVVEDINNDGFLEVVFGSYDKRLYVINASNGKEIWNYSTGNWITSSPVITYIIDSKKIIVGSHDSKVYAFNANGTVNWTFTIPTGGRIPSSPSIADVNLDGINDTIIGATDGRVYALSGKDGSLLWSYRIGQYIFSSPAMGDVNGDGNLDIVFGSLNKNQYVLDPPFWNLFGANQRRTRIFDNAKPVVLTYNREFNETHLIIYSKWKEIYSNLVFARLKEDSLKWLRERTYKLRGMIDWVNYTLSKDEILENWNTNKKVKKINFVIEVFDEYGNSEKLEFKVVIPLKKLLRQPKDKNPKKTLIN
jgi:outer membrane protein assembly factor BamB